MNKTVSKIATTIVIKEDVRASLMMVLKELESAREGFGAFNSAHEGYAVILEELDELKRHVWMRQPDRDIELMRKEAKQVAAMALRFMIDVCNEERGRV